MSIEKIMFNIEERSNEIISLLRSLIQIDTSNPPGDYSIFSKTIATHFDDLGMAVRTLEAQADKPNVFGFIKGSSGDYTLLVSAHMDVVPPGNLENWTVDPFTGEIHSGRIYGRGCADTKCGLTCQIEALRAIQKVGLKPINNILFGATVDDEIAGSLGMKYVIETGLDKVGWPQPNRVLIGEPSNLDIVGAWKGRIWYEITLKGKACHGGAPENGVNAIVKMVNLINKIREVEMKTDNLVGPDSINIGTIKGGSKINLVADECTATFDIRFGPLRKAKEVDEIVREIIATLANNDDTFNVDSIKILDMRDPISIERADPFVEDLLTSAKTVLGREVSFSGSLSAGDLYHCYTNGIPGAWIGPGIIEVAHSVDEYVDIRNLVNATKIYAMIIMKQCFEIKK